MPFPYALVVVRNDDMVAQARRLHPRTTYKGFLTELSVVINWVANFGAAAERDKVIRQLHAVVFLPAEGMSTDTDVLQEQIEDKILELRVAASQKGEIEDKLAVEATLLVHALFDAVLEPACKNKHELLAQVSTKRWELLGSLDIHLPERQSAPPLAQQLVGVVDLYLRACRDELSAEQGNFTPLHWLRALRVDMQNINADTELKSIYASLLERTLALYKQYRATWPKFKQVADALRECLLLLRTELGVENASEQEKPVFSTAWRVALVKSVAELNIKVNPYADQIARLPIWGTPFWEFERRYSDELNQHNKTGVIRRVCENAAAQLVQRDWLNAPNWIAAIENERLLLSHFLQALEGHKCYLLPAVGEPIIPAQPGIYLYRTGELRNIGVVVVHSDNTGHEIFNLSQLVQQAVDSGAVEPLAANLLDLIDWSMGYRWQLMSAVPKTIPKERGFYLYKDGQREMVLVVYGSNLHERIDLTGKFELSDVQWRRSTGKTSSAAIMGTSTRALITAQANPQHLTLSSSGDAMAKPIAIELVPPLTAVISNACQSITPAANTKAKTYFFEVMLPSILYAIMQNKAKLSQDDGLVVSEELAKDCAKALSRLPTLEAVRIHYEASIDLYLAQARFLASDGEKNALNQQYIAAATAEYSERLAVVLPVSASYGQETFEFRKNQATIRFGKTCGRMAADIGKARSDIVTDTRINSPNALVEAIAKITEQQLADFCLVMNSIIQQTVIWDEPLSKAANIYQPMKLEAATTLSTLVRKPIFLDDPVGLYVELDTHHMWVESWLKQAELLRTKLADMFLLHAANSGNTNRQKQHSKRASLTNLLSAAKRASLSSSLSFFTPLADEEQRPKQEILQEYTALEAKVLNRFWMKAKETKGIPDINEYERYASEVIDAATQCLASHSKAADAAQAYSDSSTSNVACRH